MKRTKLIQNKLDSTDELIGLKMQTETTIQLEVSLVSGNGIHLKMTQVFNVRRLLYMCTRSIATHSYQKSEVKTFEDTYGRPSIC